MPNGKGFLKPRFERGPVSGEFPRRRPFLTFPEEEEPPPFFLMGQTAEGFLAEQMRGLQALDIPFKQFAGAITAPFREGVLPRAARARTPLEAMERIVGPSGIERYREAEMAGIRLPKEEIRKVTGRLPLEAQLMTEATMFALSLFTDEQGKVGVKGLAEILPAFLVNAPLVGRFATAAGKKTASKTFEKTLNTGLDKYILTQAQRVPEARSGLYRTIEQVVGHRNQWVQVRAAKNLTARLAAKKGRLTDADIKAAADDTVKELRLLVEHPTVKGQTRPLSEIMRRLENGPPVMAGVRGELVPKGRIVNFAKTSEGRELPNMRVGEKFYHGTTSKEISQFVDNKGNLIIKGSDQFFTATGQQVDQPFTGISLSQSRKVAEQFARISGREQMGGIDPFAPTREPGLIFEIDPGTPALKNIQQHTSIEDWIIRGNQVVIPKGSWRVAPAIPIPEASMPEAGLRPPVAPTRKPTIDRALEKFEEAQIAKLAAQKYGIDITKATESEYVKAGLASYKKELEGAGFQLDIKKQTQLLKEEYRNLKPTAPVEPSPELEIYRTTRGFEEDAALRTELETKQGYELYSVFERPELAREASRELVGQDIKFVKHISTTGVETWEIYAKPSPEAVTAPIRPPVAPVEAVPPTEAPTAMVNDIQQKGTVAPKTVSPSESKYAHTEKASPDGPEPPKPPIPPADLAKAKEPGDIFRGITEKATAGERPDQTLLRLHGGAIRSEGRRTNIVIQKGNQKLKELGIGVTKRGYLVPRDKDIPILDELYVALHNPSGVASGEIAIPKGYEAVYNELRGLTDWEQSARLDFDPEMATVEDYFYRGWKPPEGAFTDVQQVRPLVKTPAFLKPRVNATYQEMRDAGFEPLFWNPYQQWGLSRTQGVKYREQMELVSYLKGMGNEFIRTDSGGALPEGWKIPRVGPAFEGKPFAATDPATGEPTVMYTRRWVTPTNIANSLENIYGKTPNMGKFIIGKKTIDPLTIVDFLTFVPKRAKLLFSFFQQVDFLTRAGAGSWTGMVDSLMAGKPVDALYSVARFPKTAWDILGANFNPSTRLKLAEHLDSTKPIVQGRPGINLKGISEAGLSTMDVTIFPEDMDKMVRQVADNMGMMAKGKNIADGIIEVESAMRRGLFQGVYPAAITTDIEKNIAPMIARQFPNMTDAQINGMIARVANIKYSVIPPEQSVFQNQVAREILRRVFFSVGESEGLLRQATGAIKGPYASFWRKHWIGVYLFLIFTASAIHFASTREPLPAERFLPVSKDNWGPLPFGYNTKFAAPTLPFKGRGDVELTLDLVGQMDTAFRVLDPGFFLSSRTSVPVRAAVNQASGTDFYGAPIDDVGPGGVLSRTAQLILDLFSPIGVGGITTEALRQRVPGAEEVIPEGESRLGMLGLGVQATGVNLRAELTRQLLDRFAGESGFVKADGTPVRSWADLEPHQKDKLLKNKELIEELALRSETSVERGYPGAAGYATLEALDKQRVERGEALVREFESGLLDAKSFGKEVTKLKVEIASRKSQVDEDFQLFQETQELPEDPNKRALVEYYSIFDKAKRESQSIDWDMVEIWEFAYRTYWTAEQEAYVDRNTRLTEWGPLMQEYIDAQDVLNESGYWDITEPNQYEKRMQLRRMMPEIEAILQKWYGYKPVQEQLPGLRAPSGGRRSISESLFGGTEPTREPSRRRTSIAEALAGR